MATAKKQVRKAPKKLVAKQSAKAPVKKSASKKAVKVRKRPTEADSPTVDPRAETPSSEDVWLNRPEPDALDESDAVTRVPLASEPALLPESAHEDPSPVAGASPFAVTASSYIDGRWVIRTQDGPVATSEYYLIHPDTGERFWLSTRNTKKAHLRAVEQLIPLATFGRDQLSHAYPALYREWTRNRTFRPGWTLTNRGPERITAAPA